MTALQTLKSFFSRPGINKSGICREMNVSRRHMDNVLSEERAITEKFYSKFLEVSKEYGLDLKPGALSPYKPE